MQHDFVDQAAQEGFFLLLRKKPLVPEGGKMLADGLKRRLKLLDSEPAAQAQTGSVGLGLPQPV